MSGGHGVAKIDGTSMAATATPFDNVLIAERKEREARNRAFIVSAHAGTTVLAKRRKTDKPGVHPRFVADDGEDEWHQATAEIDEDEAEGRCAA
jgi:aspartate kinase